MSTKQIIRSGLMGSAAIAALGLTACANSHAQGSQFGVQSHYDYESAQSCGSNCTTGIKTPAFRPAPTTHQTHYGYEGVPCKTSCGAVTSGYSTVSTGSRHVTSSYPTTSSYSQETAPCPTGTTSQPDGTCLMSGSHLSSFTGSSSYTGGSTSFSSGSYSSGGYSSGGFASSAGVADCPAGTTTQPDGSCLQRSGSSFSSHTSSTYTAPVTSTYSSTYVAPELATECCAPVTSSTSVYSGDAATETFGGYATSGSTYSASDYLPIRK